MTQGSQNGVKMKLIENTEKSLWEPTHELTWLGITLNLSLGTLAITQERINSIYESLHVLLNTPYTTARKLASFTGKIISTKYVLGDIVNLKTRSLYNIIDHRSSWDAKLKISNFKDALAELIFWHNNVNRLNIKSINEESVNYLRAFSDASKIGVGGVLGDNNATCHKSLSPVEQRRSSTRRELLAVTWGLKSFSSKLIKKNVTWYIDNYAATRILQVGSNKHELQQFALQDFDICKSLQINFKPVWIPRELNVVADEVSKCVDIDDWRTSSKFFVHLNNIWGHFSIDRFADDDNTKVSRFNSKRASPGTEAVDALCQSWEGENNFIVPTG